MFTNCPSCARQFRIRASQLTVAEGLVQCGFCGQQFNALERLYDKPLIIDRDLIAETQNPPSDEPEFDIPEIEVIEPTSETQATRASPANDEFGVSPDAASDAASEESLDPVDFPFPEELNEEPVSRPGLLSRTLWTIGVLILFTLGTLQLIWFNRDRFLSEHPQFVPYAKRVCQEFNCTLIRNRNVFAIKLVNRDVRIHPRYENSLLVNATIINRSNQIQLFPKVLISLFNTNGDVISYRLVEPKQYLDNSIDIEAGMSANTPIHFALELANSESGAVSFEFEFL